MVNKSQNMHRISIEFNRGFPVVVSQLQLGGCLCGRVLTLYHKLKKTVLNCVALHDLSVILLYLQTIIIIFIRT